MINVNPRLAILGKSSNMVSKTLRYLCFILNNLQKATHRNLNVKLITIAIMCIYAITLKEIENHTLAAEAVWELQ